MIVVVVVVAKKEFSLSKKEYRGIRGTAPLIFNFGTRWRLVVNFTPRPFIPRERTLGGWVTLEPV